MQAPSRPVAPVEPEQSPSKIEAQIQALQAQLEAARAAKASTQAEPKQDVLIQGSPSPKKRKIEHAGPSYARSKKPIETLAPERLVKPSNFVHGLDKHRAQAKNAETMRQLPKSTSWRHEAARVEQPQEYEPEPDTHRDDSLALIEKLEPGPREFKDNLEDPHWEKVEPYSRIRLRERLTAHESLQEYMIARYHLNCSQLYSIARPGRGNDMDVPVDGDFVLIGVLAEKSDIRVTAKPQQAPAKPPPKKKRKVNKDEAMPAGAEEDEDLKSDGIADDDEGAQSWAANRKPKRYVIFKLLDMRLHRGAAGSSGDSYLNMILFESDTSTTTFEASDSETETTSAGVRVMREKGKGKKKKETFRGGSGGAYERFWKENDGSVIAILNPKVLKPRPQPGRPNNNILTITPESADSILVLGKALDLGHCPAVKRDGHVCGSFYDKRTNEACDFHVAAALQKTKSGRSELMAGTSSLTSTMGGKKNQRFGRGAPAGFDPVNKTGLLPRDNRAMVMGSATYVVGGSKAGFRPAAKGFPSLSGRYNDALGGYAAPDVKKEKQEKRKRAAQKEAEEANLVAILQRDDNKSVGAKYLSKKGGSAPSKAQDKDDSGPDLKKRVFAASAVRSIGFDPTALAIREEDEDSKRKRLEAVSLLDAGFGRAEPKLGRAPGQEKKRSSVRKPIEADDSEPEADAGSDEDLVILPKAN